MSQVRLPIEAAEIKPWLSEPAGQASSPEEAAMLELLHADAAPRSVSPEAVARRVAVEDWRRRLPQVRAAAVGLARAGRVSILRHGRPVHPDGFKGVYRLGLPDAAG